MKNLLIENGLSKDNFRNVAFSLNTFANRVVPMFSRTVDMSAAKEKKRIDDDGGGKLLASPVVNEKERKRYI